MKFVRSKKGVALLVALVVAVAASVGAYAYFSATGSADGTGKVGSSTGFTVTAASESTDLFPFTQTQLDTDNSLYTTLTGGNVHNPGSGNEQLHQIVATIQAPTGTGTTGPNPCTAADFRLFSTGAGAWTISGANNGTATITPNATLAAGGDFAMTNLSVAMVDNGANQDNCQRATVNIHYAAS